MANLRSISRVSLQGTPTLLQQMFKEAQGGLLNLTAELSSVAHVVTGFAGLRDVRKGFSRRLAPRFLKVNKAKQCIASDSLHGGLRGHCVMLGR